MALVRVVLVRPEHPANIGAAARAIQNMGLEGLDLVEPGDWRTVETWRMAWRSEDVLENARVFETLSEASAACEYVAGLAGRPGARVEPLSPRQMAGEIAALGPEARVALVFGCESNGLSEAELLQCQRRVRIPASPRQPSLNLAQAVMVAGYEVWLASESGPASDSAIQRAPAADVERAYDMLREGMLEIGFLPFENPEARFVEWRDLFGRAGLTPREVKLLLGLGRRIRGAGRRASGERDDQLKP